MNSAELSSPNSESSGSFWELDSEVSRMTGRRVGDDWDDDDDDEEDEDEDVDAVVLKSCILKEKNVKR